MRALVDLDFFSLFHNVCVSLSRSFLERFILFHDVGTSRTDFFLTYLAHTISFDHLDCLFDKATIVIHSFLRA